MYVYINPCLAEDTVPNPQSVLPPLSLTYVPLPLNFVQPKIKNINLREKKCWLQTHWPISGAELTQHWQQLPIAGKKLLNPCAPHAGLWLGRGWVWCWIWEQLELPAYPATAFLKHGCFLETAGLLTLQKETLGSQRKCFLSKRPRWQSSARGKIKVIEALRVKYKAALQLCFPTIKLPPMQRGKKEGGCENRWAWWASV